jgi:hypothetical protein
MRNMSQQPSNDQLALFVRRVRRATNSEKSRHCFGVAPGEQEFLLFPEVLRTLDWLESLCGTDTVPSEHPSGRGKTILRKIAR